MTSLGLYAPHDVRRSRKRAKVYLDTHAQLRREVLERNILFASMECELEALIDTEIAKDARFAIDLGLVP